MVIVDGHAVELLLQLPHALAVEVPRRDKPVLVLLLQHLLEAALQELLLQELLLHLVGSAAAVLTSPLVIIFYPPPPQMGGGVGIPHWILLSGPPFVGHNLHLYCVTVGCWKANLILPGNGLQGSLVRWLNSSYTLRLTFISLFGGVVVGVCVCGWSVCRGSVWGR